MSRCRMVYAIGGESLNDVKKKDRYMAPPLALWDEEGEPGSDDEPFYPPAPGPAPQRPQKPKYLQRKAKRQRLNPPEPANPTEEPGPSGLNQPNPNPPTRVSGRARRRPNRLVEE